ncbi:hypothetical protein EV714DRAFT_281149 [Schizophyllum commune]
MGRHIVQQQKKDAARSKFIEWGVSEGQRGRKPSVPAVLKRRKETGMASVIRDMEFSMNATSTEPDSAQYPGDWLRRRIHVASPSEVTDLILAYEAEADVPLYGIAVETNVKPGRAVVPVQAPGLVYFAIKGTDLNPESKTQTMELLQKTDASNLVVADVYFTGRLHKPFERAAFQFLGKSNGTLTHLRLHLPCYHLDGLEDYLCSAAAIHLVCLDLYTNELGMATLIKVLGRRDAHRLPDLRRLSLQLKRGNVSAPILYDALRERRVLGPTQPITVETRTDVDDKTYSEALKRGITFTKPPLFPSAFHY